MSAIYFITIEPAAHTSDCVGEASPLNTGSSVEQFFDEQALRAAGGGWNEEQTFSAMQIRREMMEGSWRVPSHNGEATWAVAKAQPISTLEASE